MPLVKAEPKGEILVIAIDMVRLVDQAVIDQCYREIAEHLDKTDQGHVLLHFGRVAFMSSAALGMLVRLNKKCKEYKVSLRLCGISAEIGEVFAITGLNKVFSIHADAADAMEAFKQSGKLFFRSHRETRHDLT